MPKPYAELSPLDRVVEKTAEMSRLQSFGRLSPDEQAAVLQLAWRVAKATSRDVEAFLDGMSGAPFIAGRRIVYDEARHVARLVSSSTGLVDRSSVVHVAELGGILRQLREIFPKRELLAAAVMGLGGHGWRNVGHAIVEDAPTWRKARRRVSRVRGN